MAKSTKGSYKEAYDRVFKGAKKGDDKISLRGYIPITLLCLLILFLAYVFLSNPPCFGGPSMQHECSTIADGGGNQSCMRDCGNDTVVTETYCMDCNDCYECFYGCDKEAP